MNLPTLFPKASASFLKLNEPKPIPVPPHNPAPAAQPKRSLCNGSLATCEAQKVDSAFYLVRITSFRSRLIDSDNLCGKWHCDALRYAGVLPDDAPERALIETRQIKCAKGEERTEILIEISTPPPPPRAFRKLTVSVEKKVGAMVADGKTWREIAEAIDWPEPSIYKVWTAAHGVTGKLPGPRTQ